MSVLPHYLASISFQEDGRIALRVRKRTMALIRINEMTPIDAWLGFSGEEYGKLRIKRGHSYQAQVVGQCLFFRIWPVISPEYEWLVSDAEYTPLRVNRHAGHITMDVPEQLYRPNPTNGWVLTGMDALPHPTVRPQ